MPYELFLALRYLRLRRGRRVAKWTALAAIIGIACGVGSLIVALALARGFREELQDKILGGTAHITVTRTAGAGASVEELRRVAARVRSVEGVSDAAPTAYEGALINGPRGAAYAVLRGLDERSAQTLSRVKTTLTAGTLEELFDSSASGESPAAAVLMGTGLAAKTGLDAVGAQGWILTGEVNEAALTSPEGFTPRVRHVRVAGLFESGLYDYDAAWAYLSLAEAEQSGGGSLRSPAVSIETRDIYAAGDVAALVRSALGGGWEAVDWREANRPLFAALELERRTVSLIILLVTIVAALNITTTLALVVTERRTDIAVLSALGGHARSVMTIFLLEGAIIGAAGALIGVMLGVAACYLGDHFQLVRLPADVYSISAVPLRPRVSDVMWTALAAFVVSLLATLYPARQAARIRPAEALRYE